MSLFFVISRKVTATMPTDARLPVSINRRFAETRPMNIIRKTTPNSNAAVDKFSGAMSRQITPVIIIIRLKAFGLAPSSSCPLDRMKAVTMITAILAISEGWNCMPMNVIQRAAPLIRSIIMTSISSIAEAGNRKTGNT